MIRLILLIFIFIVVLGFGLKNSDQEVALKYFFGLTTPPLPVYQVVLGTLVIGVFLVGLLLFPEWIRMRLTLRRQRKALERMEEELSRLRFSTPRDSNRQNEEDEG